MLVLLTAMFEMLSYEHYLFEGSHCVRTQQTCAWRQLLVDSKQFNCFCKSPSFHTLFKILFVWLLLYLNVLFEPLACLQKSVFHRRAIVLSQEPWKSATKCSQYDAVLLVISSTLVIMYTTCFKNKLLWILCLVFICMDRLCGIVVSVPGYRSGGPGLDSRALQKKNSGSGTGSTQPREYNWGATWKK
jgi:hypothetical protein